MSIAGNEFGVSQIVYLLARIRLGDRLNNARLKSGFSQTSADCDQTEPVPQSIIMKTLENKQLDNLCIGANWTILFSFLEF